MTNDPAQRERMQNAGGARSVDEWQMVPLSGSRWQMADGRWQMVRGAGVEEIYHAV